jgi:hypothetical protein
MDVGLIQVLERTALLYLPLSQLDCLCSIKPPIREHPCLNTLLRTQTSHFYV